MKTLLLLILFCSPTYALNLGNIRTDVRSLITDGQGTRQRFSDTEIDGWINEGQRLIDVGSLCHYKSENVTLVSGTTYYPLSSSFIEMKRVTKNNTTIPELTPDVLDGRTYDWEKSSGTVAYYFIKFSTRGMIGVYPTPDSTDSGTLRLEYAAYSTELSATGDVPFDNIKEFYAYHYALSFYAAYKASVIDERDAKAKVYMESFGSIRDIMRSRCTERINYSQPSVKNGN